MTKSETIRARVEPTLKARAEDIFKKLGLSSTEAITLFYTQVTLRKGLPFNVEIPNKETADTIEKMRHGKGLHSFDTIEEMFADLEK